MCSIEEAAALTFNVHDPDNNGLLPASQLRSLLEEVYKRLDRKLEESDVQQIAHHMNRPDEISINLDEFIRMVKDTIKEQGRINDQSDI